MGLDPVDPFTLPIAGHLRHIVPPGVSGKGEKIEMPAGVVDAPLQRADAVPHFVVVVKITPVKPILGAVRFVLGARVDLHSS